MMDIEATVQKVLEGTDEKILRAFFQPINWEAIPVQSMRERLWSLPGYLTLGDLVMETADRWFYLDGCGPASIGAMAKHLLEPQGLSFGMKIPGLPKRYSPDYHQVLDGVREALSVPEHPYRLFHQRKFLLNP